VRGKGADGLRKVACCRLPLLFDLYRRFDLAQAISVGFIYTSVWRFGAGRSSLFQSMKSRRCRFDNVLRSALVKE
jgi:hypothetical protein